MDVPEHTAGHAEADELVGRIGISPNRPSFRLGGLRTHVAAAAFLAKYAKASGAMPVLMVRIDDTNQAKAAPANVPELLSQLTDVGRVPLGALGRGGRPWIVRQGSRAVRYQEAVAHLRQRALVWDSEDGTVLTAVSGGTLATRDEVSQQGAEIIRITRRDGSALWHLASAVDDLDAKVGICVRGIDKRPAEAIQRAIISALGGTPPACYYLPLVIPSGGTEDLVSGLRLQGFRDEALFAYIAHSLHASDQPCLSFGDLAQRITIRSDLRARVSLDYARLAKLDRQAARLIPGDVMAAGLESYSRRIGDSATAEYLARVPAATLLESFPRCAKDQHRLAAHLAGQVFDDLDLERDHDHLFTAARLLASSAPDALAALTADGTEKGKAFRMLRWILCGMTTGPDPGVLRDWHQSAGTLDTQLALGMKVIRDRVLGIGARELATGGGGYSPPALRHGTISSPSVTELSSGSLSRELTDSLFPHDLPEPGHWEQLYPQRDLPEGAEVTRFAPSPTGFLHIGSVFTAGLDLDVAHHTGGVYVLRIEDTDQARLVEGAAEQFTAAFSYFGMKPDETENTGNYGPYRQSARSDMYLSYVRELLRGGQAYPCFATKDELADITAQQKAAGALPGYYGKWAVWRDAPEEHVKARLEAGDPYVVRFRSPGTAGVRVTFTDAIRGEIAFDDNRNDVVILKSSDQEPRLPTYHFAHAVDDHLMRITLVIRTDEWLPSVPLHHQLFDALGFTRPRYAHAAPLMKQDGGSRRKLSKRKDAEADVAYYISQGYPAEAVQYYLRGLANGRLAEMPLPEALADPIRLAECGAAGPLLDMVKLDDISADYVATLTGEEITDRVQPWAETYDPDLVAALRSERPVALAALAVERGAELENPRKDLRKWADFRPVYGYFFRSIFEPVTDPADERFGGLSPDLVRAMASGFAANYQPPSPDTVWFDQVRDLAARLGFAKNQKTYKKNPDEYPGSIADASAIIRVLITGTRRSPDMAQICEALGEPEVLRRVNSLATAT